MRVLLATDCYPPPLVGGRELQVQMLAHELSRRGHDVEVVSLAVLLALGRSWMGIFRFTGWRAGVEFSSAVLCQS